MSTGKHFFCWFLNSPQTQRSRDPTDASLPAAHHIPSPSQRFPAPKPSNTTRTNSRGPHLLSFAHPKRPQQLIIYATIMSYDSDRSDGEDELLCPLCMDELDVGDRNFKPCQCGYQVDHPLPVALDAALFLIFFFTSGFCRADVPLLLA